MAAAIPVGMGMIGDYSIDLELSSAPGEVSYEATHVVLPRHVRITVARDRAAAVRMLHRACTLESLRHPGIPRVFDCGMVAQQYPWMATELVRGKALPSRFATAQEAAAVIRDVAAILDHAHQRGVIHNGLWLDAIVRDPDRGFPICLVDWSHAQYGNPADGAIDIRGLGLAIYAAMPLTAPSQLTRLIDEMLAPKAVDRPTAATVHAAASRIAELSVTDEHPPIEEIDLVVDLSRELPSPAPRIPRPRWTPAPYRDARPTTAMRPIGVLRR